MVGTASQQPPTCYDPLAAELASLLVRSISYEIPSLKKQISRCQQAQQDFARREEECQLGAAELRERFFTSCKQYGITVSPCGRPQGGGVPAVPLPSPKQPPDTCVWPQRGSSWDLVSHVVSPWCHLTCGRSWGGCRLTPQSSIPFLARSNSANRG